MWGRVPPIRIRQLTPQALGEDIILSRSTHAARHRATPVRSGTMEMISTAVSSNAGHLGRPAAALAAASALMLGVGAPAQASATANGSATASPSGTASSSYTANTGSGSAGSTSYTVQSGDTLGQIAAQHGVSLNKVLSLNGLTLDSIIYPGDVIALPGGGSTSASAPVNAQEPQPVEPAAAGAGAANTPANSGVSLAGSGYAEIPASSTNAAILASAKAQLGAIQDCTVLGEKALEAAGISGVGDESPESLMEFATPVSNPQPGDFIYYADGGMGFSHNAVYIGNGKAIHSGWNGNQTVVKSVDIGSGPVYYRVNG
ncbi:hypothetical protein GCM10027562_02550 [Arthrobacter pigmenti]